MNDPLSDLAAATREHWRRPVAARSAYLGPAQFSLRVIAALIDVVLILFWATLSGLLLVGDWDGQPRDEALGKWAFFVWLGCFALAYMATEIPAGATIGQAVLDLRAHPVWAERGRSARALRWVLKSLPVFLATVGCLFGFLLTRSRDWAQFARWGPDPAPWTWLLVAVPGLLLLGLVMSRSSGGQAPWDRLAGTNVHGPIPTLHGRGFEPVVPVVPMAPVSSAPPARASSHS